MSESKNSPSEPRSPMTAAEYIVMGTAAAVLAGMAVRSGIQPGGMGVAGLWLAAALVPLAVAMPKIRIGRMILVADGWLAGVSALSCLIAA